MGTVWCVSVSIIVRLGIAKPGSGDMDVGLIAWFVQKVSCQVVSIASLVVVM